MIGNPNKDVQLVGHGTMSDFGATRLYDPRISRPGEIIAPTLRNYPKASMGNINKVPEIQVQTVLPGQQVTPLKNIKSSYVFLPQGNQNKAGR